MILTKDYVFYAVAAVSAPLLCALLGVSSAHADTLYITTAGDSTITTYNTVSGGTGPFASGGDLAAPQQLAFDGQGVLYVTSPNHSSVLQYSSPSNVTAVTSSTYSFKPTGVAVTSSGGTVYAGDYFSGTVYSYDPADASATLAPFITGLSGPTALALNAEGTLAGDLFVANTTGSDILVYNPLGGLVSTFTGFTSPEGLAFDKAGDLYVSDAGADTVEKIPAASLTTGSSHVTATATLGGLSGPRGLAFDSEGNLYVAEYNSGLVLEVNSTLTDATTVVSGLDEPAYIAVPEPSTWAMLIAAGAGLGYSVRRRQRRARA